MVVGSKNYQCPNLMTCILIINVDKGLLDRFDAMRQYRNITIVDIHIFYPGFLQFLNFFENVTVLF